jgi:hypothetical protein
MEQAGTLLWEGIHDATEGASSDTARCDRFIARLVQIQSICVREERDSRQPLAALTPANGCTARRRVWGSTPPPWFRRNSERQYWSRGRHRLEGHRTTESQNDLLPFLMSPLSFGGVTCHQCCTNRFIATILTARVERICGPIVSFRYLPRI